MKKLTQEQKRWTEAERQAKKETAAKFKSISCLTVKLAGTKGFGCQYLLTEVESAQTHADSIGGIVKQDTYKPSFQHSRALGDIVKVTARDVIDREEDEMALICFDENLNRIDN